MKKYTLLIALFFFVALIFLPFIKSEESLELSKATTSNAPGQFVQLSNGNVHYQLLGAPDGPIVVFIHGFSVPSYTWERNIPHLVDLGYRVLSYDLYGRGYSSRPTIEYDRSLFVIELAELLEALNIHKKVNLVGISMGGGIAAAFATDYPEKIQSLIFLAPFHSPVDIGLFAIPIIGEYIAYSFYVPDLPEAQLESFVNPEAHIKRVDKYRQQMKYSGFSNALLTTARGFIQSNPIRDFRKIGASNVKSLLLWGDKDATFPIEQANLVKAALSPNVKFKIISNAGHALHYERAGDVNTEISAFLGAN